MSNSFVLSLIAELALVMCVRLVLGGLPLGNLAERLSGGDALMSGIGLLGLAFHCGAMFFTGLVNAIPGAPGSIEAIKALGTASIVWYVAPAVLVLAGLRRLHWSGVVSVSLALIAPGVTMFNGWTARRSPGHDLRRRGRACLGRRDARASPDGGIRKIGVRLATVNP